MARPKEKAGLMGIQLSQGGERSAAFENKAKQELEKLIVKVGKSLSDDLLNLFELSEHSDLIITNGSCEIPAHKSVFQARAQYLWQDDWVTTDIGVDGKEKGKIFLNGLTEKEISDFVRQLYTVNDSALLLEEFLPCFPNQPVCSRLGRQEAEPLETAADLPPPIKPSDVAAGDDNEDEATPNGPSNVVRTADKGGIAASAQESSDDFIQKVVDVEEGSTNSDGLEMKMSRENVDSCCTASLEDGGSTGICESESRICESESRMGENESRISESESRMGESESRICENESSLIQLENGCSGILERIGLEIEVEGSECGAGQMEKGNSCDVTAKTNTDSSGNIEIEMEMKRISDDGENTETTEITAGDCFTDSSNGCTATTSRETNDKEFDDTKLYEEGRSCSDGRNIDEDVRCGAAADREKEGEAVVSATESGRDCVGIGKDNDREYCDEAVRTNNESVGTKEGEDEKTSEKVEIGKCVNLNLDKDNDSREISECKEEDGTEASCENNLLVSEISGQTLVDDNSGDDTKKVDDDNAESAGCSNANSDLLSEAIKSSYSLSIPYETCSPPGTDLLRMYLQQTNCDCCLCVDGVRFLAHRCILSTRSSYFNAMLGGRWCESDMEEIKLQGISAQALEQLLLFLYGGVVELSTPCDLFELFVITDMYGVDSMKSALQFFVRKDLCHFFHKPCSSCVVTASSALNLCHAFHLQDLEERCLKWSVKYFTKIWSNKTFAALPEAVHQKCAQCIIDAMTEKSVLDTIMECNKLSASLPRIKWTESVLYLTTHLMDSAIEFTSSNFIKVIRAPEFLHWGKVAAWKAGALEEIFNSAIDSLPIDTACSAYQTLVDIKTYQASLDISDQDVLDLLDTMVKRCEKFLKTHIHQLTRSKQWESIGKSLQTQIMENSSYIHLDQFPDPKPRPVRRTVHVSAPSKSAHSSTASKLTSSTTTSVRGSRSSVRGSKSTPSTVTSLRTKPATQNTNAKVTTTSRIGTNTTRSNQQKSNSINNSNSNGESHRKQPKSNPASSLSSVLLSSSLSVAFSAAPVSKVASSGSNVKLLDDDNSNTGVQSALSSSLSCSPTQTRRSSGQSQRGKDPSIPRLPSSSPGSTRSLAHGGSLDASLRRSLSPASRLPVKQKSDCHKVVSGGKLSSTSGVGTMGGDVAFGQESGGVGEGEKEEEERGKISVCTSTTYYGFEAEEEKGEEEVDTSTNNGRCGGDVFLVENAEVDEGGLNLTSTRTCIDEDGGCPSHTTAAAASKKRESAENLNGEEEVEGSNGASTSSNNDFCEPDDTNSPSGDYVVSSTGSVVVVDVTQHGQSSRNSIDDNTDATVTSSSIERQKTKFVKKVPLVKINFFVPEN